MNPRAGKWDSRSKSTAIGPTAAFGSSADERAAAARSWKRQKWSFDGTSIVRAEAMTFYFAAAAARAGYLACRCRA